VYFTGTGPSAIQPNQPYEVTDANGRLEIPGSITSLAGLIGAVSASGEVDSLNLIDFLGNQSPHSINALSTPILINNVSITPGQGIVISLPVPPKTLTSLPITVNAPAGDNVVVALGSASGSLQLYDKNGSPILGKLAITCGQPTVPVIAATLNVKGQPNTTLDSISNGFINVFPPVPIGYQIGSFRFPTTCSFSGLGNRNIDLTVTGTLPTTGTQGKRYSFVNSTGALRIPASVVSELIAANPGASQATAVITAFNLSSTLTKEGQVNFAQTPVKLSQPFSLAGDPTINNDVLLVVPQLPTDPPLTGTFTVNSWTGNQTSEVAIRNSGGVLTLLNANGAPVGSPITVACQDPGITLLILPITWGLFGI